MRDKDIATEDTQALRNLVASILAQAVKDYRLKQKNPNARVNINERFFYGKWCEELCLFVDIDPEYMRSKLGLGEKE